MVINSKVYDILKWVCLTAIPALIVFLNVLLPSIGVDAETTQNITKIVGALATFIGTIIGISSVNYATEMQAQRDSAVTEENVTDNAEVVHVTNKTKVEFNGKYYELTGKENQILASYSYTEEEYDCVRYLYGGGNIVVKQTQGYRNDAEREERYNYITEKYPDRYPVKWSYDTSLTLAQNYSIAKGQTTKEEILKTK